ncbi:MAG: FAD-binding protein [Deltaproteobacteria bacterium]|nr:FAD-binding protein [Deltaproteobacteria bacterium]MCL5792071.1 FAD-binding protein [Deltaproteobacteria bacterium]
MSLQKAVIKQLKKICPDRVFTDQESQTLYSYDATKIAHKPDVVVFPVNVKEISEIVKTANNESIPVVPRGAGTGLTGGSVPIIAGIVLSMEKMNHLLSLKKPDLIAEVEPGIVTGDLQNAVQEVNLFYPPDPASHEFSTIGGNIAENAGGLRAIKYGTTSNYVLGLEVVLPSGDILWLGKYTHKGVVGYNLNDLFIGSEGTLGIITRAVLKLIPKPQTKATMLVSYSDVHTSTTTVTAILDTGILPSALEFMDQASIKAVSLYQGKNIFDLRAGSALLVEVDGSEETIRADLNKLKTTCERYLPISLEIAYNNDADNLWKARRAISPALARIKPDKLNEDIVVPLSKLPELVAGVEQIGASLNVHYANFGHAGDGNIHVNFLYDAKDVSEYKRALSAVERTFDLVLNLGGSISGEHGVGITKLPYITKELSAQTYNLMKAIKVLIDPNNIMNPGKAV